MTIIPARFEKDASQGASTCCSIRDPWWHMSSVRTVLELTVADSCRERRIAGTEGRRCGRLYTLRRGFLRSLHESTPPLQESTPPLRQYLGFLKRHAWLIVLVPVVAIALAWLFVSRQTSVYRAEMGIIVAQAGGTGQPQIGGTALTQTMQNIITSDVIARRVAGGLDLPVDSSDLLKKIKTTVKPSSSVITVSTTRPTSRRPSPSSRGSPPSSKLSSARISA